MNSKQVRSMLCSLSPTEVDTLKNEYSISSFVNDISDRLEKFATSLQEAAQCEDTLANWLCDYIDFLKNVSHKHTKPVKQRAKEVAKRRKKNKNKKTHRKK